jgi:alpha-glucosidase
MNYAGFALPVWHWLSRFEMRQHAHPQRIASATPLPTSALVDTWRAYRAAIPWVIARQQYNLLGSHDTPRILSILNSDPALNRLAAGLLMTYLGAPAVYYGEEIGLKADSRECMSWDRSTWDEDLHAFYRALIRLRRASPALIDGGFQVLEIGDDWLAYLRDADEEQIVVVGQRGPADLPTQALPVEHGAIPDGAEFVEMFSGMRSTVAGGHLPMPAMPPGIWIWQARLS